MALLGQTKELTRVSARKSWARNAVVSNCEGDDGVMRSGRIVDRENPFLGQGCRARLADWDPICELTSGPAVMKPRKQAGHMTLSLIHI